MKSPSDECHKPTDHKSTLGQVMAWCRQATSHYLSQCWPRFMSPNGVSKPQWVNVAKYKTHHNSNYGNYMLFFCYIMIFRPIFHLIYYSGTSCQWKKIAWALWSHKISTQYYEVYSIKTRVFGLHIYQTSRTARLTLKRCLMGVWFLKPAVYQPLAQ